MIIWILLFLAVSIISFLLTLRSMRHYRERPDNLKVEYSVYLVQNLNQLTTTTLESLCQKITDKQLIISFEKLSKGNKLALVIYGPKVVLGGFTAELGLIELEDYSTKLQHFVSCWEIGDKPSSERKYAHENFSLKLENSSEHEQLWWQIVVQPEKDKSGGNLKLRSSMRILMQSPNQHQLNSFNHQVLTDLENVGLSFLPQVYSIHQLVRFYRDRALGGSVLHRNEYITHLDLKSLRNLLVS
jgi:hypothetical protein